MLTLILVLAGLANVAIAIWYIYERVKNDGEFTLSDIGSCLSLLLTGVFLLIIFFIAKTADKADKIFIWKRNNNEKMVERQ